MNKTLKISIVRPGKPPYNTEGKALNIPSCDGYIGILPNRQPLLSIMNSGIVSITNTNDKKTYFAISGGFAEVIDNEISLLCDIVVTTKDLPNKSSETSEKESIKKTTSKFYTTDVSKLTESEKREYLISLLSAKISKEQH